VRADVARRSVRAVHLRHGDAGAEAARRDRACLRADLAESAAGTGLGVSEVLTLASSRGERLWRCPKSWCSPARSALALITRGWQHSPPRSWRSPAPRSRASRWKTIR